MKSAAISFYLAADTRRASLVITMFDGDEGRCNIIQRSIHVIKPRSTAALSIALRSATSTIYLD
jgi:hypothetical protein